jgi:hypothetical protein
LTWFLLLLFVITSAFGISAACEAALAVPESQAMRTPPGSNAERTRLNSSKVLGFILRALTAGDPRSFRSSAAAFGTGAPPSRYRPAVR